MVVYVHTHEYKTNTNILLRVIIMLGREGILIQPYGYVNMDFVIPNTTLLKKKKSFIPMKIIKV